MKAYTPYNVHVLTVLNRQDEDNRENIREVRQFINGVEQENIAF